MKDETKDRVFVCPLLSKIEFSTPADLFHRSHSAKDSDSTAQDLKKRSKHSTRKKEREKHHISVFEEHVCM